MAECVTPREVDVCDDDGVSSCDGLDIEGKPPGFPFSFLYYTIKYIQIVLLESLLITRYRI